MTNNEYVGNGDIVTNGKHFAIQLNYNWGGGGRAFRTFKYATWENSTYCYSLQESNEDKDLIGWKKVTLAELVLTTDKQIVENLKIIQDLVKLGYKGRHNHNDDQLADIEWRMHGYR